MKINKKQRNGALNRPAFKIVTEITTKVMKHTLENNQLTVQVNTHGAELSSVKSRETQREFIWQADPAVWARHAPVLFPIVGKLAQDQYRLDGKTYTMSQHGFARDQDFRLAGQQEDQLTFELAAHEETKHMYPFDFVLRIGYQLSANRLQLTYQVKNAGRQPMPFSIGGHPAFYAPAQQDKHWEEYALLFEKNETLDRHFIENGLRNGQTKRLLDDERLLPLHRHLFEDDAIIFEQVQSDWVSLVAETTGEKIVTVYMKDFPYLGIWQKLGADFYCIEPWCGLADKAGFTGDFTGKEGVQLLEAGKVFEVGFGMEFYY